MLFFTNWRGLMADGFFERHLLSWPLVYDLVILEMVGKSRDLVITADLILMSSIFPNSHSHSAILCWA